MTAIFDALNLNPWTFLFQAINLLVVIGVLHIILHKPLGKILAEREEKIEGSLKDAAVAKEKAENLLLEYRRQMEDAHQESQAILEKAAKIGEETQEKIIAKAQEEASRTLEQARAEIESEKGKALAAIRDEAATLVVMAAGKVLEKSLTDDDQMRLAREAVAEVKQLQ